MISTEDGEKDAATVEVVQRLPLQVEPVIRTAVGRSICGDAGVEASSDYNDPEYFFLNWPASV